MLDGVRFAIVLPQLISRTSSWVPVAADNRPSSASDLVFMRSRDALAIDGLAIID